MDILGGRDRLLLILLVVSAFSPVICSIWRSESGYPLMRISIA